MDALSLQESDSVLEPDGSEDKRGITSDALWDSLKTCCLHLGRLDLATICDRRELDGEHIPMDLVVDPDTLTDDVAQLSDSISTCGKLDVFGLCVRALSDLHVMYVCWKLCCISHCAGSVVNYTCVDGKETIAGVSARFETLRPDHPAGLGSPAMPTSLC